MSEELKKEWVDRWSSTLYFTDYDSQEEVKADLEVLANEILAKQQEEISQRITEQYKQNPPYLDASSWWNYGLKMTFAQYFLEKQQEEFVKIIEDRLEEMAKRGYDMDEYDDGYNTALKNLLADIKSKLK